MTIHSMIATIPGRRGDAETPLARCIEACLGCAAICTACADACLREEMAKDLAHCIRTDLDCADLCAATAAILIRKADGADTLHRALIEACAEACRLCGEECSRHAGMHEHCRICADACRTCEEACRAVLR